ncbi:hypothetical protein [Sulfitobacter sp. SK012]|nr:hypothetical protein [Sulfitobacter sp. SK012]
MKSGCDMRAQDVHNLCTEAVHISQSGMTGPLTRIDGDVNNV